MSYWFSKRNIEWCWRAVADDDTGLACAISPLFGSLHAFPARGRVPSWLALVGCTRGRETRHGWESDLVDPPVTRGNAADDLPRRRWREAIGETLRRRPLALVLNEVEGDARPSFSRGNAPLEEVAAALDGAWSYSREPECLARALFRYRWLRERALYPKLFLGMHVPTDLMHAWVSLDGRILGEEPDDMLCYQGAVCFYSRSAPFSGWQENDDPS